MNRHAMIFVLAMLAGVFIIPAIADAGLCVWRLPDRDIKEIYGADSYKTILVDVSPAHKEQIEQRLGAKLDPDESQFRFWPVYKKGVRVGTVSTHLTKADYGAIEVVIALEHEVNGKNARVKEIRIQRDREKARKAIRSAEFLGQFTGKTSKDPLEVGKDIRPADGTKRTSHAIVFSVKKQLIAFEVLMASQAD
ncbi:MAG TPA: hypothetical protein PLI94_02185 [Bacillota bacterium]|nr:hypothetical protein [Bacillota bacterium]